VPEDGSPFLGPGASSFKFIFFIGIIIMIFIADYLSIFLPYPVIIEFLFGWAEVDIFDFIIPKLIRIEDLAFIVTLFGQYFKKFITPKSLLAL